MFAYCLNNPISYSDSTGNYTAIANRNFCNYEPLPESCGGGAIGPIITFGFLEWVGEVIVNGADAFDNWIDNQKQAVADKVSKSLAKSKTDAGSEECTDA